VRRNIDITYLPPSGVYVIQLQLNQTPYESLASLIRDRSYLNHSYAVPGTQDRPEPPRSAVRVAFSAAPAGLGPSRPVKVKKQTLVTKAFSLLRKLTPRIVDKCAWLWDNLPHSLLLAFGVAVVVTQVCVFAWAWSIRDGKLAHHTLSLSLLT
jgi:hypothetical protein